MEDDKDKDFASRITSGFNNATAAGTPEDRAKADEAKRRYMDAMKRRQMAMRE